MEWRLGELDRDDIAVDGGHHAGEGNATFSNYRVVSRAAGKRTTSQAPGLFAGDGNVEYDIPPKDHAEAQVVFEVEGGRVTISQLEFWARDMTLEMIRSLSLGEVRAAILDELQEQLPIVRRDVSPITSTELRREWPHGDNLERLLIAVARVYNAAIARERPPTMAVANEFDVSRATASRMVAKARELNLELAEPAPYPGKRKRDNDNGSTE